MSELIRTNLPTDRIRLYCTGKPIRRLSVFGSAVRNELMPDSDIDLLIEYFPDAPVGYFTMAQHMMDFSEIIGRRVDLATPNSLSPYIRQEVLNSASPFMRKTRENNWLRLQHMSDAAKHARQFAEGKSRRALDEDLQLQFALARAVEIVCEAACNITDEFQTSHPRIAWKRITGMRQWLAHAYFKIDLDVLWKTTVEDLPPLISQLDVLLSSQDAKP